MELVEDLTQEIERMAGRPTEEIVKRANEVIRAHNQRMRMHLWFQALLDGQVSA